MLNDCELDTDQIRIKNNLVAAFEAFLTSQGQHVLNNDQNTIILTFAPLCKNKYGTLIWQSDYKKIKNIEIEKRRKQKEIKIRNEKNTIRPGINDEVFDPAPYDKAIESLNGRIIAQDALNEKMIQARNQLYEFKDKIDNIKPIIKKLNQSMHVHRYRNPMGKIKEEVLAFKREMSDVETKLITCIQEKKQQDQSVLMSLRTQVDNMSIDNLMIKLNQQYNTKFKDPDSIIKKLHEFKTANQKCRLAIREQIIDPDIQIYWDTNIKTQGLFATVPFIIKSYESRFATVVRNPGSFLAELTTGKPQEYDGIKNFSLLNKLTSMLSTSK
jgi:hypothetical protein